jgi:acyl-CoA thioester hydrolase
LQDLMMSIPTPFVEPVEPVKPEWLDENNHMNVAYYLMAFDSAFYGVYRSWGVDFGAIDSAGRSTFAAQSHLSYLAELRLGDSFWVETMLADFDRKRIRWFMSMKRASDSALAATCEWLVLFIDMRVRKVAPMPDSLFNALSAIKSAHDSLPRPAQLGRGIAMRL